MPDLITDIKIASAVYELAKKQGWLDQLLSVLKTKHKIIVLGTSGTGKTQFVTSLSTLLPAPIGHADRSTAIEREKLSIQKSAFEFVTAPGEGPKKARRREAIREAMKGCAGIINVVSYGYHEGDAAASQVFELDGVLKQTYLSDGRKEELNALNEWTADLGDRLVTKWLITVVSKADLWWDEKESVLKHYRSGEYFSALGEAKSLDTSVLPYCSEVHKFYGRGLVSPNFDDKNRTDLRAHLLKQLVLSVAK